MMYARRASEFSTYLSSSEGRESPNKNVIAEEEEYVGDGQPEPPTEIFKGMDLPRSDTPDTYLTDIADKPDITLFCDQCRLFLDIRLLKHHRAYHSALQLLNYKGKHKPESSEQLLKKRSSVLRSMKKEATVEKPLEPKHIQQVNEAYELLKSDLEDTFEAYRHVRETVDTSCRGMALSCSPECVYALGMCSSPNSKWKSEMEDTKMYQDSFGENTKKCYLGLFDGYHGRFSAEVTASLLHKMLLHELMKFDSSLKQGPLQGYDGNSDISHHSFVFGAGASLDGEKIRGATGGACTPAEADPEQKGEEAVTVIQPDDDELTRRIIQLCEDKHEKLMEDLPPTTPKSSHSGTSRPATKRCRHPMEEKIMQAFVKSYQLLDILLSYGKDEWSKVRWSGCSALSMVIEATEGQQQKSEDQPQKGEPSQRHAMEGEQNNTDTAVMADPPVQKGYVHLANAGDVRALLVRGNRTYRISKDHTPSNSRERERIIRDGGTLNTSEVDCQVNGVLSTTRGLGNHGDPALKKCVLVEPHTCSVQIDQYAQFIILATRGVWEVLSDQEVGSLLLRMLPGNKIPPPSKASSTLDQILHIAETPNADIKPISQAQAQSMSESLNEKGSKDAEVTEEKTPETTRPNEGLKIAADLKTEAGSHCGGEDIAQIQSSDQDMVAMPLRSQLDLGGGVTAEERRRELAQAMAEHIVQAALLAGSHNNITVMVILLPGCGA